MPDLTTASAMPLIMSSLTLQPNLFHEFHPIGGVGASALGFTVFSCAGRPAVTTKTANTTTATEPLVFMRYVFIRTRCIFVQGRLKRGEATSAITILRSPFYLLPERRFSMGSTRTFWLVALVGSLSFFSDCSLQAQTSGTSIGVFESHTDVGTVLHPGSVEYDNAKQTYTVAGSGENMWSAADAFHFVWKKVSGDVTLAADISFANTSGNEHKKAVLIFRQSLDADSVYADVALHASGLTSLQFRDEKGAITREVQSNLSAPKRLRIA